MHQQFKRNKLATSVAALLATGLIAGCGGSDDSSTDGTAPNTDAEDTALKFDTGAYTTLNITVNGAATTARQYKIVYVAKPIKAQLTQTGGIGSTTLTTGYEYQTMYVTVPAASVGNQSAPIYMSVNNAGWMASAASASVKEGGTYVSTSNTDVAGAALAAGYIVVDVGTRSRGIVGDDGTWMGKAPAPVVDAKAAIRYLRLNDSTMPGSAERIVLHGTSGGGGLTAVVAASGNSTDYLSFLADVGAAGVSGSGSSATSTLKDDVFAAVAYCPINNLGNADAGYEYEYNTTRSDSNTGALGGVAYSAGPQVAASAAIAATFEAYVSSLNLKLYDDATSTLTSTALTGAGLLSTTKEQVKQEVQRKLAAGTTVPALGSNFTITSNGPGGASTKTIANDWLTWSGTTVSNIDYDKFRKFVATNTSLKTVVAFDAVGVTGNRNASTGVWNISGETNLFGSATQRYSNFSAWSWNNNQALGDDSGTDDTGLTFAQHTAASSGNGAALAKQIKLVNPIAYLNSAADSAPYWYVRHGMVDRDTAFAMQSLLYQAIRNDSSVKDVNFKLPYLTPHSGDYDVQEAFAWIKAKVDANP